MDTISISLSVQAWNVIMQALAHRPYGEVAELIPEIKRQAEVAVKATADLQNSESVVS